MGKTIRQEHTSKLGHNGDRGPKHSLLREYNRTKTIMIKDWCYLINNRDYESDRQKGWRHIGTKLCRTRLKRDVQNEINQASY